MPVFDADSSPMNRFLEGEYDFLDEYLKDAHQFKL